MSVVGIRFREIDKIYQLKTKIELVVNESIVVKIDDIIDYAKVVSIDENFALKQDDSFMEKSVILRKANEDDKVKNLQNKKDSDRALIKCEEIIQNFGLGMKLIDASYTFDKKKLSFYYIADGRVDFRELLKKLASKFKTRIELRQIGIRDKAKIVKGIGKCGQKLCCSNFISTFVPVTIKMARDQDISLNTDKMTGVCGKLMCCMNFENEVYNEIKKTLPDVGEKVKVDEKDAIVVSTNTIKEEVKVKFISSYDDLESEYKLEENIVSYKISDVKRSKCKCPKKLQKVDGFIVQESLYV